MLLDSAVTSPGPHIPERLKNRLFPITTCILRQGEISAFTLAFHALDLALASDPSVPSGLWANVLFVDRDSVTLNLDPGILGNHLPLVIYPLHRWRERELDSVHMMACALEELCHHFWSIRDETLVKDKVIELIQLVFPKIERSDIFVPNWSPDAGQ